jgi:hypothetical protein
MKPETRVDACIQHMLSTELFNIVKVREPEGLVIEFKTLSIKVIKR